MRSARISLFLFSFFLAGVYLYTSVLPYHFSDQKPVSTADLENSGFYDKTHEEGEFHGQKSLSYEIPQPEKLARILGDSDGANKRIEVDLSSQRVYAFEGDRKVYEFVVSTGKWGLTPTGTFRISYKTRATKMSGGNKALNTYYYLPNVPYVQFFGNNEISWSRGYSFHGTYWHNNFGHPMSHGCINMKTEDAETLFYWTKPSLDGKKTINASETNQGTPVTIYGTTPNS